MPLDWRAGYGTLTAQSNDLCFVVVKNGGARWVALYYVIGSGNGLTEVPGPYTHTRHEAQTNAEHFEQEHARIGSP